MGIGHEQDAAHHRRDDDQQNHIVIHRDFGDIAQTDTDNCAEENIQRIDRRFIFALG